MNLTTKQLVAFIYIPFLSNFSLAEQNHIALSRVGEYKAQNHKVNIKPTDSYGIIGKQAKSFTITKNDADTYDIALSPNQPKGLYTATLEIKKDGESNLHQLNGIVTEKFEGHHEPSLYKIFNALAIDVDVAGDNYTYSTKVKYIGSSQPIEEFRVAEGVTEVLVTLIARYSPQGTPEIGFAINGEDNIKKIGNFADVSETVPDAHQRILPAALQGEISTEGKPNFSIPSSDCPTKFGFYYKGKHYTSLTYSGKSKDAPIHHTARVFKVGTFMGRKLKDAYIICYEEAKNGDYQDAVILVEGVTPIRS